ncbi:MAG TPA: response regulator [Verrucomicrobiae bacterium]
MDSRNASAENVSKLEKGSRLFVLVDDNEDDAFLLSRQVLSGGMEGKVRVFNEAGEAKTFLAANPAFILIVALSMRRDAGFELLNWVRAQPQMQKTLIVAVGLSERAPDVQRAFDLGANAYYAKGIDLQSFRRRCRI